MKYLILLEGSTEKAFIEILMDKGIFAINADDMLDMRPHQKRQIDTYLLALIRQLDLDDKVKIIKIGDKMSDKLRIPKDIINKIESEEKYCTKPEFEMLLILAEGLTKEYGKVKSTIKPKSFAKEYIVHNKDKYTNSSKWIKSYFEEWNTRNIKNLLQSYKKYKHHHLNENYLIDLLIKM